MSTVEQQLARVEELFISMNKSIDELKESNAELVESNNEMRNAMNVLLESLIEDGADDEEPLFDLDGNPLPAERDENDSLG